MTKLRNRTNGNGRRPRWYRRAHRWVGVSVFAFVLFLATTGIALNHASDFDLDRRYINWSWFLDAYGLEQPAPYVGMVVVEPMVVVGDGDTVHVLLTSGELVESIDLGSALPAPIDRLGLADNRAVLQSGGALFRADEANATFAIWPEGSASEVRWSGAVRSDAPGLEVLDAAWRGPGLTVERVLQDLHSGRILKLPGTLFMDLVAVCLIFLGLSGLALSRKRKK